MIRQTKIFKLSVWTDTGEKVENSFFKDVSFSKITKLTPTHIKGLDLSGKQVEFRSLTPVNYFLKQIK